MQKDENTGKIRLTGARSVQLLGSSAVHRAVEGRSHLLLDASDGDGAGRHHSLARSRRCRCRIRDRSGSTARSSRRPTSDLRAVQRRLDRDRRDAAVVAGVRHALRLGSPVRAADRRDRGLRHDSAQRDRRRRSPAAATPKRCFASTSTTLPLTDTTFAAASGNRNWIAFGEGHKPGAGRVIMVADSTGPVPNFFSPLVTISDLTDNASEQVFGLALDLTRRHGGVARRAVVLRARSSDPFHLRLQGKYDSFDNGAGIAFHPHADGTLTPAASAPRLRRRAQSASIEIVDIAYYINRGKLPAQEPDLWTAARERCRCRAIRPDVILKLYAVSEQGLIVIDLTAADIKPGPP